MTFFDPFLLTIPLLSHLRISFLVDIPLVTYTISFIFVNIFPSYIYNPFVYI